MYKYIYILYVFIYHINIILHYMALDPVNSTILFQ